MIELILEGKVCSTILQLYNEEAIVAEPAGALTIAVLDTYQDKIKGKNMVCVVSCGNNDITRTEEIKAPNRETGPALVGIDMKYEKGYDGLIERMEAQNINFQTLNDSPMLFDFLV